MSRARLSIRILITGLLLVLGWQALTNLNNWRAKFADSNFQANSIRLQAYYLDQPAPIILAGSSVTARLDPSYFSETQTPQVANLGLDGCVVAFSLEVAAGRPVSGKCVLVENYSLLINETSNEKSIQSIISGAALRLPRHLGAFRAHIRPTALIYSELKKRKDRSGGVPGKKLLVARKMADLTPAEIAVLDRSRTAIAQLRKLGARVVLLRLPYGETEGPASERELDYFTEFAAELNAPEIDLPSLMRAKGIELRYSDGLHMVAPTAKEASRILGEELSSLLEKSG